MTATAYDEDGQDVADYEGQVLAVSGGSVTFENLAPNAQLSYDVYVYSATTPYAGWQDNYSVGGTPAAADPTAPSLDNGDWYFWGTVTVAAGTTSLSASGPSGGRICLLQQTAATVYDADGNVTATIAPRAGSARRRSTISTRTWPTTRGKC